MANIATIGLGLHPIDGAIDSQHQLGQSLLPLGKIKARLRWADGLSGRSVQGAATTGMACGICWMVIRFAVVLDCCWRRFVQLDRLLNDLQDEQDRGGQTKIESQLRGCQRRPQVGGSREQEREIICAGAKATDQPEICAEPTVAQKEVREESEQQSDPGASSQQKHRNLRACTNRSEIGAASQDRCACNQGPIGIRGVWASPIHARRKYNRD